MNIFGSYQSSALTSFIILLPFLSLLSVPSPASSEPSVLAFSSPPVSSPPPPPQALHRFKPASSPLSQAPQASKFTYHLYPSLRCVAFMPPVASSFHYCCFHPSVPCGVLCRLFFEDIPSCRAILLLTSQLGMAMLEDLTRDAWIIPPGPVVQLLGRFTPTHPM
ncbi:hypothetical protein C8J57DRAFT_1524642 [Mycena rebaudengoi]|nr:hypothetical protein C8J57DRAFT_1524642 [Mycena rebaudengoi]